MALVFISIFGGVLWRFPVIRVCVTVGGLVQSSFLGSQVSGYCCNFMRVPLHIGRSFTVLSVWGVLLSLECFGVFVVIIIGYYCYYYFHRAPGSV